jgi:hypothetical protein
MALVICWVPWTLLILRLMSRKDDMINAGMRIFRFACLQ